MVVIGFGVLMVLISYALESLQPRPPDDVDRMRVIVARVGGCLGIAAGLVSLFF